MDLRSTSEISSPRFWIITCFTPPPLRSVIAGLSRGKPPNSIARWYNYRNFSGIKPYVHFHRVRHGIHVLDHGHRDRDRDPGPLKLNPKIDQDCLSKSKKIGDSLRSSPEITWHRLKVGEKIIASNKRRREKRSPTSTGWFFWHLLKSYFSCIRNERFWRIKCTCC